MYLTRTKAILSKAMKAVFDADYPVVEMRGLSVELEYPVRDTAFPSVWVTFDPIGPLKPVGVDHTEFVAAAGGNFQATSRWSFAGNAIFSAVAMSSLERDRIFDEMTAVIAFARYDSQRSAFRTTIETDPLIQLSIAFDEIDQRGFSAAPGTPWGTDDIMYEASIALKVIGEFVNQPGSSILVPISQINVHQWVDGVESDPTTGDGQGPWIS